MKYIFPILIIIAFIDFGYSQNKTKRLKFSGHKFEYPKTWKIQRNPFGVQLLPKKMITPKKRLAFVHVTQNSLRKLVGETNILSYLKKHAETPDYHIKSKTYTLTKLEDNDKFQYKITSEILFVSSEEICIREEFFKIDDKYLSSIMYQAKKNFFKKYYDEAMSIINSFEKR